MKGKEIIHEMTRAKMPDTEQVRATCHAAQREMAWDTEAQSEASGRFGLRRMRLGMAVIVAAVTMLFAGTAVYALGVAVGIIGAGERLDVGGEFEYVFVAPDDPEYLAMWDDAFHSALVYVVNDPSIPWRQNPGDFSYRAERAHRINALLVGQIYTADGAPFPYDLFVPHDNPFNFEGVAEIWYRMDTRGHVLHNADGEQIGSIRTWEQHDVILEMRILSLEAHIRQEAFANTFEDVTRLLGTSVHLPTVHLEAFNAPVFSVCLYSRWAVVYFVRPGTQGSYAHIRIRFENARVGEYPLFQRIFPGTATHHIIADTDVFEISGNQYATYFMWEHDGIVYRLYPPYCSSSWDEDGNRRFALSDVQMYELIASMIR